MFEYQAILLAGALGGLMSTFVRPSSDVPWPTAIETLANRYPLLDLALNLLRNTLFGAGAAVALWASANARADFTSTLFTPLQLVLAATVGGGGVEVLNSFFRRYQDRRAIDNAAEAILNLGDQLERARSEEER